MEFSHVLENLTNNFKIDSKIFQYACQVSNILTSKSELRTSQESDRYLSVYITIFWVITDSTDRTLRTDLEMVISMLKALITFTFFLQMR